MKELCGSVDIVTGAVCTREGPHPGGGSHMDESQPLTVLIWQDEEPEYYKGEEPSSDDDFYQAICGVRV